MFIAILTYKKPLDVVDENLSAHRAFLAEHYAAGDCIASGPRVPREGWCYHAACCQSSRCRAHIVERPFPYQWYCCLSDSGVYSHAIL